MEQAPKGLSPKAKSPIQSAGGGLYYICCALARALIYIEKFSRFAQKISQDTNALAGASLLIPSLRSGIVA